MENDRLKIGKYVIWLLLISLIIFRYFTTRPAYKIGDRLRITATVYSDPIIYTNYQSLRLAGLRVYLPRFPEIDYGDEIVVEGIVGDKKLEKAKLIEIKKSVGFGAIFRNNIISFYQKVLPEPSSGLVSGITLGSKGALTNEFWAKVKNSGVAHVVVASGTNVTFVASFLMGTLTAFLPRRKAILFVILGIIFYLFVSGFEAPLIRAAIMAGFAFLAQEMGRMISGWRVLLITGGVMLAISPDWLIDIGFILSFVSTGALLLFERPIREKLKFVPEIIKEGLSTSLAAQIGVAPILFVTFGQFNIWSPVANALVLWTVPYIMILGAVGGVAGLIIPFFGKLVLWLAYPFLWWFTKIVEIFSF
jgi:competence protein ComEC